MNEMRLKISARATIGPSATVAGRRSGKIDSTQVDMGETGQTLQCGRGVSKSISRAGLYRPPQEHRAADARKSLMDDWVKATSIKGWRPLPDDPREEPEVSGLLWFSVSPNAGLRFVAQTVSC